MSSVTGKTFCWQTRHTAGITLHFIVPCYHEKVRKSKKVAISSDFVFNIHSRVKGKTLSSVIRSP